MPRDVIEIAGLNVSCVVGVRPDERDREQALVADLRMVVDLARAGRSARISDTVDYSRVADLVVAQLRFRRFRVIENAAEECAAMVLGVFPKVVGLRLRLAKPDALAGRAAGAAVCIARTQEDFPRRWEQKTWGRVEILLETREAGLYLLHVDPGQEIPRHHHRIMDELEWLVRGRLVDGEREVATMTPVVWPHGAAHSYANPGPKPASLFCCDYPPFIPSDEIEDET